MKINQLLCLSIKSLTILIYFERENAYRNKEQSLKLNEVTKQKMLQMTYVKMFNEHVFIAYVNEENLFS